MSRTSKTLQHAERVGTAELRGNLAKHLRAVGAGRALVIQDRGRDAYLLSKLADESPPSVFGCMRDRTDHGAAAVVNAAEPWSPGVMP